MEIDFEKMDGLVPAIIQDAITKNVLMLGFMNKEAYDKTIETKKVTFWSRSRNCLWTKGETSGNFLNLVSIQNDCDNDTLLVKVHPDGPTCHSKWDIDFGSHAGYHIRKGFALFETRCNIEEYELVCSSIAISFSQFYRVTSAAKVYEIGSLYRLAVLYIKTRNDSFS